MTISRFRILLKKGYTGTFRMLKPGEAVEPADLIVEDCFYDFPAERSIGALVEKKDCILRFEVEDAPKPRRQG